MPKQIMTSRRESIPVSIISSTRPTPMQIMSSTKVSTISSASSDIEMISNEEGPTPIQLLTNHDLFSKCQVPLQIMSSTRGPSSILSNLGGSSSMHFVSSGGGSNQFQIVSSSGQATSIQTRLDEHLQDTDQLHGEEEEYNAEEGLGQTIELPPGKYII